MPNYKMNDAKREQYSLLCENGIGWNIPYAKGTFTYDENGKRVLAQEKTKQLYEDIMSHDITNITVEGGKRGGKDVFCLFAYANYLMSCKDKLHLVTGQSQAHAIKTVHEADGFGLKFLLPHGEMQTEDNRKIFKFLDYYGVVKQVMFYGGEDANDYLAFEGITFGSHYANEAINQHINTILKGASRTIASKWRKIIHTQNPKGGMYAYYTEYEKPLIASEEDSLEIEKKKEAYLKVQEQNEKVVENKKKIAYDKIFKKFKEKFGVKSVEELKKTSDVYQAFIVAIRDTYLDIDRNSKSYLRYDILKFKPYYPNPNGVRNGLDYRYFHFTMYDNLSMTDYEREKVENGYDKTSALFKRDVRGIRASSDNCIFDTLSDKNILKFPIPNITDGFRYIAIDYGVKNDFVALDCDINERFEVRVWRELRINGRKLEENGDFVAPTNGMYAQKIKEFIHSRNNGKYVACIVDPSARAFINELRINGIGTKKADNNVGVKSKHDISDKKISNQVTGIWFVRDGFARLKIFIHEDCVDLRNECEGYCLDPAKLKIGVEEPYKVNDHGPDALRYVVNTVVKTQKRWLYEY